MKLSSIKNLFSRIQHPYFIIEDNVLTGLTDTGKQQDQLVIPEGITHIGNDAFHKCSSLTSIKLPDNLTHIGNYAFSYCSSLTSIQLPDSITHIGDYAFSYCSSLTSIELPDSLAHVGNGAFNKCQSLSVLSLPFQVLSQEPLVLPPDCKLIVR